MLIGLEPCLERLNVLAVHVAGFLKVDFEYRAIGRVVFCRPLQADNGVEDVLPLTRAPLRASLSRMVYEEHRAPLLPLAQCPRLDR